MLWVETIESLELEMALEREPVKRGTDAHQREEMLMLPLRKGLGFSNITFRTFQDMRDRGQMARVFKQMAAQI